MNNDFKRRVRAREQLHGMWLSLCHPTVAEIAAGAGFDWLVIDVEHAPNTLPTVLAQLRAIGTDVPGVVRLGTNSPVHVGPFLDIGARNLLVPMVESARSARELVASVRYPPHGVRGHASALTRASAYGRDESYVDTADEHICLIAQIETPEAVADAHDIAAVDGIDALFVGLYDLSARLGFPNRPDHHHVQSALRHVVAAADRADKPTGAFAPTPELAELARRAGCRLIATGSDIGILGAGVRALAGWPLDRAEPAATTPARGR